MRGTVWLYNCTKYLSKNAESKNQRWSFGLERRAHLSKTDVHIHHRNLGLNPGITKGNCVGLHFATISRPN